MKKTNFLLAIAVMASMSLISCNGNGENASKGSGSQAVSTEQTAEGEQPTEEVKIEDQKELTCDAYTITVPEGWKASSRMVNNSCNLTLKENPHTTAALNTAHGTVEEYAKNLEGRGAKAVDDITVGDKTYKVFMTENNERANYEAFVAYGDGLMTYRIMPGGTPMKGDELKEVLLKNLNDIINATALK